MMTALLVLNREEALGRLEGDIELWSEIRDIWIEDADALMDGVEKALESKSADALRRASHALKGSSANVGASRVAALAKIIEMTALEADWPALSDTISNLKNEVKEAKKQLAAA